MRMPGGGLRIVIRAVPVLVCLFLPLSNFRSADIPPLKNPSDPLWHQGSPEKFFARMETSKGSFVIQVHRDWAPHGAGRFFNLVRSGFFDDSRFFRVRAGFIAQFGIPGNPEIAALWRTQVISDDPPRESNRRGTLAFAMTGPDTRTTQLYLNLSDNRRLTVEGFAPIGEVVQGMNVVDQLYSEYGEASGGGMRGGKQGPLFEEGNAYLDREFPRLDRLVSARLKK